MSYLRVSFKLHRVDQVSRLWREGVLTVVLAFIEAVNRQVFEICVALRIPLFLSCIAAGQDAAPLLH